jgi:DNA-binding transcriptional ArsR family regulator
MARHQRFVYNQIMIASDTDHGVAAIAAAIGEPARARMLFSLMDGHARTSTELAVIAEVSPSTASAHLTRLRTERLVDVHVQGKHRYYRLESESVAAALESLTVLAGRTRKPFVPTAPSRLRVARTCYDHIAGSLGVALHDRLMALAWLTPVADDAYELTHAGNNAIAWLGIDVAATRAHRRRFAFACLDWSERRPHVGGALGGALLDLAVKRRWLRQDLDSRALTITRGGRREFLSRFGLEL